jgi:hypothetical protein
MRLSPTESRLLLESEKGGKEQMDIKLQAVKRMA